MATAVKPNGSMRIADRGDGPRHKSLMDWLALVRGAHAYRDDGASAAARRYRCQKTLENVYGSGKVVTKAAMSEASGVTGGYLMPTNYSNRLLKCVAEESFILPRATQLKMTSSDLTAPRIRSDGTPTAGQNPMLGGLNFTWGFEQTPTETEPTFVMDAFHAWDLLGYCVVTNQWLDDTSGAAAKYPAGTSATNQDWNSGRAEPSSPKGSVSAPDADGDDYLLDLFGKAAAWYAEFSFLQGLGSAGQMPLGIINSPAAISVTRKTAGANIDVSDITGMTGSLLPYSWKNAIWATSPTCLNKLQQVSGYFINIELAGLHDKTPRPCGVLSTLPLFITDKLPPLGTRGDLILFDPSLYIVAMRQEVVVDVSGDDAFQTNKSTFRIWLRLDAKPQLSGSVITQDTTTKVSPYIVLK